MERERKTEAGRQVQALKQEVKYLKAKDDALTARQERIRTDLKSGRVSKIWHEEQSFEIILTGQLVGGGVGRSARRHAKIGGARGCGIN